MHLFALFGVQHLVISPFDLHHANWRFFVPVLDMYCVKPLDAEGVIKAAQNAKAVITVEEHAPFGGLGSMVAQVVGANCPKKVLNMALPDAPVITGNSQEVFDYYGFNCQAGAVVVDEGTVKGKNLPLGKAYLQKLYDDIAKR